MKRCIPLILWALNCSWVLGQNAQIDSLKRVLAHTRQDTSRVLLLAELGYAYVICSTDTSMKFSQQALALTQKIGFRKGEVQALSVVGYSLNMQGDFPRALTYQYRALKMARQLGLRPEEAFALSNIGAIYYSLREWQQVLAYSPKAQRIYASLRDTIGVARLWNNMAVAYLGLNQVDSARYYAQKSYTLMNAKTYQSNRPLQMAQALVVAGGLRNLGQVQALIGDKQGALAYYHKALRVTYQNNNLRTRAQTQILIAQLFDGLNQPDSSIYYAYGALIAGKKAVKSVTPVAATLLAKQYKVKGQLDSVVHYLEIAQSLNEAVFGPKKFQELQLLALSEQQRQQALEASQKEYENWVRFYALLAGLMGTLLIAFILYRNNQQKHKANELLQHKNGEIQRTLSELKATQTQLIQREKMASLGELTAGIAHEIQNPLNFVNNFAEVSVELADELEQSVDTGQLMLTKELATDLRQNMHHIAQNGQRASNIVKGMLEHSRTSTGEHQPTDLNALCDEYLRLAYQGIRAKDNSFNCQLETHFDADLPLVSVVASDMSRVLLNLFNNAFYAVGQKQKTASVDYQPTVWVSTAHRNGCVEIRVRDNGMGIPDAIKEKIFQPFFTTKPTGEGTGLGLSLSYDIVTKGHGGEMRVESEEQTFAEFIISLPLTSSDSL